MKQLAINALLLLGSLALIGIAVAGNSRGLSRFAPEFQLYHCPYMDRVHKPFGPQFL